TTPARTTTRATRTTSTDRTVTPSPPGSTEGSTRTPVAARHGRSSRVTPCSATSWRHGVRSTAHTRPCQKWSPTSSSPTHARQAREGQAVLGDVMAPRREVDVPHPAVPEVVADELVADPRPADVAGPVGAEQRAVGPGEEVGRHVEVHAGRARPVARGAEAVH